MKNTLERKRYNSKRTRRQFKKSGYKYWLRRQNRLITLKNRNAGIISKPQKDALPIILKTPEKLNFIERTDELIDYFKDAKECLKNSVPIAMDISHVTEMTPDSIAFFVSQITSLRNYKAKIIGNEPINVNTQKIFRESGFYKFVKSKIKHKGADGNLMHKESNYMVVPHIAANGTRLSLENGNYDENETEAIYNIFIELMSNTHHHANLTNYGITKWWLYVYSDKATNVTSICFLDLGVGIFKSIVVKSYIRKIKRTLGFTHNIDLVDDLINGNIASRIEADNEIRGKGIPQITSYSTLPIFKSFYMITNNVKVDFKKNTKYKLHNNFAGTLFYFELCPQMSTNQNGN